MSEPMNIAEFDQTLAEANQTLDSFAQHYRALAVEHGPNSEAANVSMLAEALESMPVSALAVLVAAAVRRLAAQNNGGSFMVCPRCGLECSRDEVHNGVAMLYGPWGCACGWSESKDYDLTAGPSREGLFAKFHVERTDGRDKPGGDKAGARYFVLDYVHDENARAALALYADLCEPELPALAADLWSQLRKSEGSHRVDQWGGLTPGETTA